MVVRVRCSREWREGYTKSISISTIHVQNVSCRYRNSFLQTFSTALTNLSIQKSQQGARDMYTYIQANEQTYLFREIMIKTLTL
jgi:hypothetical protein